MSPEINHSILIYPSVWRRQTWAENLGSSPFGRGAGSPSNSTWPGPWITTIPSGTLSIQPFGHNTPTLRTDRQTTVRCHRANSFRNGGPKTNISRRVTINQYRIATRGARRTFSSQLTYLTMWVMGKMRACGNAAQSSGPKSWGCCVIFRRGSLITIYNVARAEDYLSMLSTKWHLDRSIQAPAVWPQ